MEYGGGEGGGEGGGVEKEGRLHKQRCDTYTDYIQTDKVIISFHGCSLPLAQQEMHIFVPLRSREDTMVGSVGPGAIFTDQFLGRESSLPHTRNNLTLPVYIKQTQWFPASHLLQALCISVSPSLFLFMIQLIVLYTSVSPLIRHVMVGTSPHIRHNYQVDHYFQPGISCKHFFFFFFFFLSYSQV